MKKIWACKWGVLRLAVACFALWVIGADAGARMARLRLAELPDFDYAGEIRALREAGRYGEALTIASSGLRNVSDQRWPEIQKEKEATVDARDSALRKIRDLGKGALSGRGESLEEVLGAITVDMLLVGDLRDLVIEGGKQVFDGEADEVIMLLSGVGVATNIAPTVDWAPAMLKTARKTGAMTQKFGEFLLGVLRQNRYEELGTVGQELFKVGKHSGPAGAMTVLRQADSAEELSTLTRFVERADQRFGGAAKKGEVASPGTFAILVTGEEGAAMVKGMSSATPRLERNLTDRLVVNAAKKGKAGRVFLKGPYAKALLSPHPMVGAIKGLWKGNLAAFLQAVLDRWLGAVDKHAWWLVAGLVMWIVVELGGLGQKLFGWGEGAMRR